MFFLADFLKLFEVFCMNFTLGLLHPFYIGTIFITYIFYKKVVFFEQSVLIKPKSNLKETLFDTTMFGILVGFIIGFIINILGIPIKVDSEVILFVWLIMMILSLINLRYLGFAYVGGMVVLFSLIFKWHEVDVSGLLVIIGLLYLAEALLVLLQGEKNAIPVFVKYNGETIGGFLIQKFWTIPITLLVIKVILNTEIPSEVVNINNPNWWPVMNLPDILSNQKILFSMLPIPALLGYSEMTIADTPKRKVRRTAIFLGLYSIVLIILSVISSYIYIMKYVSAVYSILAYELIMLYEKQKEKKRPAYFSVPDRGVRVLDVIPGGPADCMGIIPGDIILHVNNKDIMTQEGIFTALNDYPTYIWVDILRDNKKHITLEYRQYPKGINDLEIISIPRYEKVGNIMSVNGNECLLHRLIQRLK